MHLAIGGVERTGVAGRIGTSVEVRFSEPVADAWVTLRCSWQGPEQEARARCLALLGAVLDERALAERQGARRVVVGDLSIELPAGAQVEVPNKSIDDGRLRFIDGTTRVDVIAERPARLTRAVDAIACEAWLATRARTLGFVVVGTGLVDAGRGVTCTATLTSSQRPAWVGAAILLRDADARLGLAICEGVSLSACARLARSARRADYDGGAPTTAAPAAAPR